VSGQGRGKESNSTYFSANNMPLEKRTFFAYYEVGGPLNTGGSFLGLTGGSGVCEGAQHGR
jgi:hypothetical protein